MWFEALFASYPCLARLFGVYGDVTGADTDGGVSVESDSAAWSSVSRIFRDDVLTQ